MKKELEDFPDGGENVMNPIALLRSKYDTLTNAEQKLADYIMENPRCMLEGRMSQLSKNAGSSNAALARLSQKLGYEGFSDFRFSMNNYLLSQGGDRSEAGQENVDPIENILDVYTRYIKLIPNYVPREQLQEAAKRICTAKRICIWGFNRTYQSACQLSNRLGRMGIFNKCTDDWIVMTDDSEIVSKEDLCIVLSLAGRGFSGKIGIIDNLKKRCCPLLLITMDGKMPIAQKADWILLLPRVMEDSQDNFFEDQIIVYVMLELLLYEVASLKVSQNKEEKQP